MGKYQGYKNYKDSGVEWLGAIPKHWEAIRLKHITNQIIDGAHFTPTYVSEGIPFLRVTDIVQSKNNSINLDNIKFIPEEEHNTLSLRCKPKKGDLLYSKNGTIGVPRIVDWDFDFSIFVSLCLIKIIKQKINVKFLQYSLLGKLTETQINIGAKSNTVTNLHLDKIKEFWVSLPPLDEQETIACFLDYKTKQIDNLIAKKEALLEKLDEKRTALISHAVTKGLEPNVPMKDSGIEWLGKIPKHWDIVRLKYLSSGVTVGIVITPAKYYVESGVSCLRSLNIKENRIDGNNLVFISEESNEILRKSKIYTDDLVAVRTGQPGTTAVVTNTFNGTNCIDLIIIKKSNKFISDFLCYQLNSLYCKHQFSSGTDGAIQQHFNIETACNLLILIPQIKEQEEITNYLDQKTSEIDQQKAKIKQAIELLKEYRTALITNAVTGKIDVRQVPIP